MLAETRWLNSDDPHPMITQTNKQKTVILRPDHTPIAKLDTGKHPDRKSVPKEKPISREVRAGIVVSSETIRGILFLWEKEMHKNVIRTIGL